MLFRLLAFKSFSLFQVIAFKRAIRVWEVKPQPFQRRISKSFRISSLGNLFWTIRCVNVF
jgi:hypothetical protein